MHKIFISNIIVQNIKYNICSRRFIMYCIAILAFFLPLPTFSQGKVFLLDSTKAYVSSATSNENELNLKDEVTLILTNWMTILANDPSNSSKLLLYINDMPVRDVAPVAFIIDSTQLGLRYFINYEEGVGSVWEKLILTREKGKLFTTRAKLSIGFDNQLPFQTMVTDNNRFKIGLVKQNWFITSIVMLVIFLIALIVIAKRTDLLRSATPPPPQGKHRPYSLARTQMALWFFVIMASWLLLFVVKQSLNTIPDTMMVLMGISAGTGLGAVAIDKKHRGKVRSSRGFMRDILQDENGITIHRFQMVAWTIVLTTVFIWQVAFYLKMPEFNASLLVMMGISSGTYLGYKSEEKPKEDQETATGSDTKETD
jgi:hypothetical protein